MFPQTTSSFDRFFSLFTMAPNKNSNWNEIPSSCAADRTIRGMWFLAHIGPCTALARWINGHICVPDRTPLYNQRYSVAIGIHCNARLKSTLLTLCTWKWTGWTETILCSLPHQRLTGQCNLVRRHRGLPGVLWRRLSHTVVLPCKWIDHDLTHIPDACQPGRVLRRERD